MSVESVREWAGEEAEANARVSPRSVTPVTKLGVIERAPGSGQEKKQRPTPASHLDPLLRLPNWE